MVDQFGQLEFEGCEAAVPVAVLDPFVSKFQNADAAVNHGHSRIKAEQRGAAWSSILNVLNIKHRWFELITSNREGCERVAEPPNDRPSPWAALRSHMKNLLRKSHGCPLQRVVEHR